MTDDDAEHYASLREVMAAKAELRRRVDTARGRLIAATIVVEDHVDQTLVAYFQSSEPEQFQDWVLAEMTYNNKLQLLRKIIKHSGLWEMYGDLWKRIDDLRVERNNAAHASFALRETGTTGGVNILLSRRSKRGQELTDLDEINNHAARAERLVQECIALDHFVVGVHERMIAAREEKPGPDG